jgi:hypothetical protein
MIGSQQAEREAGILLNGTVLAVDAIDVGASEGVVYTSRRGAWIVSELRGTGGMTFFGPGPVMLAGDNRFSGGAVIESGTVIVANASGTGLGGGPVVVNATGTLVVKGRAADVAGSVFVSQDSKLVLEGGTVGGLEVQYGGYLVDGGLVEGWGTIAGPASISGAIQAGAEIGTLTFLAEANFVEDAFFTWTLAALDDTPGHQGRSWNSLAFQAEAFLGGDGDPVVGLVDFRGIPGPDSGDPFWSVPHRWLIADFSPGHAFRSNVEIFNGEFAAGSFEVQLIDGDDYMVYTPKS